MGRRRYRSSASFGKRQEFAAIGELLRRGYDVYLTLVDDRGIDCVIRQSPRRYFDVQIKARSKDCKPKNAGLFPLLNIRDPRRNYVFIFYSEHIDTYWTIPSVEIVKPGFANQIKSGPNKGKFRLMLTNYSAKRDCVTPRPKYEKWINVFGRVLGEPAELD